MGGGGWGIEATVKLQNKQLLKLVVILRKQMLGQVGRVGWGRGVGNGSCEEAA